MSEFRGPILKFFLTFSQSREHTKEYFHETFIRTFPIVRGMCVTEKHEDGNPHIHAWYELKTKRTKREVLEFMKSVYPNDYHRIKIEGLRSMERSVSYMTEPEKVKYVDPSPILFNFVLTKTAEDKFHQTCRIHGECVEPEDYIKMGCICNTCRAEVKRLKEQAFLEKDDLRGYENRGIRSIFM